MGDSIVYAEHDPPTDDEIEAWVAVGVRHGYAVRSSHFAYDGVTLVRTLVLQTEAVQELRRKDHEALRGS